MKAAFITAALVIVSVIGWAEVSYKGIPLGCPWDEVSFRDEFGVDYDDSAPGQAYFRFGELLGDLTEEHWYKWKGRFHAVLLSFDNGMHDRVAGILEGKYGENQSVSKRDYATETEGCLIVLSYDTPDSTLLYMTLEFYQGVVDMQQRMDEDSGL